MYLHWRTGRRLDERRAAMDPQHVWTVQRQVCLQSTYAMKPSSGRCARVPALSGLQCVETAISGSLNAECRKAVPYPQKRSYEPRSEETEEGAADAAR